MLAKIIKSRVRNNVQQHVLMVEDDEDLGQVLSQFLTISEFSVEWLKSGDLVMPYLAANQPDIILMDVQLPVVDGVSLCKSIREKSNVPIIMLTSKSDEVSRLIGLQTGADDYVCKPFSAPELILRIKAILRRSSPANTSNSSRSPLLLDKDKFAICYGDNTQELTVIEVNLLDLLLSSPNRVFSREQIFTRIYSSERHISDRTIDSHIKNVRKKLEQIGAGKDVIESVYGAGYRYSPSARSKLVV